MKAPTVLFVSLTLELLKEGMAAEVCSKRECSVPYYRSLPLSCLHGEESDSIDNVQVWILPSGDTIKPNMRETENTWISDRVYLNAKGTVLTIKRADSPDFGPYFCVVAYSNGSVDAIKKTVSLDTTEFTAMFKNNVVIGAVSAGILAVLIILALVICKYCIPSSGNRKANSDAPEMPVLKSSDNTSNTLDIIEYDTADGIQAHTTAEKKDKGETDSIHIHDTRIPSYESGHYHSIDEYKTRSLERDAGQSLSITVITEIASTASADDNEKPETNSETEMLEEVFVADQPGQSKTPQTETGRDGIPRETHPPLESVGSLEVNFGKSRPSSVDSSVDDVTKDDNAFDDSISTQPIYATPKKRPPDKEMVKLINGEVTLESSGASVGMVTSTSHTHMVTSPPTSVMPEPSYAKLPRAEDSLSPEYLIAADNPMQTQLSNANDNPPPHVALQTATDCDVSQTGSTASSPATTPLNEENDPLESNRKLKAALVIGELQSKFGSQDPLGRSEPSICTPLESKSTTLPTPSVPSADDKSVDISREVSCDLAVGELQIKTNSPRNSEEPEIGVNEPDESAAESKSSSDVIVASVHL